MGWLGEQVMSTNQRAQCLMPVLALLLSTEAVLKLVLPSYPCVKTHGETAQERAVSLREKGT